ncbi:hypothetical protein D3C86_1870200 [compost metagenome]
MRHVGEVVGHAERVLAFKFGKDGLRALGQGLDLIRRCIAVLPELRIHLLPRAAQHLGYVFLQMLKVLLRPPGVVLLICLSASSGV